MKSYVVIIAIVSLAVSGLAEIERDTALLLAATQGDASRVETEGAVSIVRLKDGRLVKLREIADGVEMRVSGKRLRWREIADGWICGKRRLHKLSERRWAYRDQDGKRYRITLTAKGSDKQRRQDIDRGRRPLALSLAEPLFQNPLRDLTIIQ